MTQEKLNLYVGRPENEVVAILTEAGITHSIRQRDDQEFEGLSKRGTRDLVVDLYIRDGLVEKVNVG